MLQSLEVHNFRSFQSLKIDKLARINLVTGLNSSGKTTFLESIFLLSSFGNPQMVLKHDLVRNYEPISQPINSPEFVWETLWKPMFPGFDLNKSIQISGVHSELGPMALKVELKKPEVVELKLNRDNKPLSAFETRALAFYFRHGSIEQRERFIQVGDTEFRVSPPEDTPILFPAALLTSAQGINSHEMTIQLGKLRAEKKSDPIVRALQMIEPKLQGIEDNSSMGFPTIMVDIKSFPTLVPLQVMGEGMKRIARIALRMFDFPSPNGRGVVLIDEIENGIHHSVLPKLWQFIYNAAIKSDIQVIATTHSYECIRAAQAAIPEDSDWLLHRLKSDDEKNSCVTYTPDEFSDLDHYGLEVR